MFCQISEISVDSEGSAPEPRFRGICLLTPPGAVPLGTSALQTPYVLALITGLTFGFTPLTIQVRYALSVIFVLIFLS